MKPIRIALVADSKAQLTYPAPARDLFTGRLFVAARELAEARLAAGEIDTWFVLSAEHYLLAPGTLTAPYAISLSSMSKLARMGWSWEAYWWLHQAFPKQKLEVTFYAGRDHRDHLVIALERNGDKVNEPTAGMTIDEQLAWLAQAKGARP